MRDYAQLHGALHSDLGIPPAEDRPLTSDLTWQEAARVRLSQSFYKKLAPNGTNTAADAAALEKFLRINRKPTWRLPELSEFQALLWSHFRHHLNSCVGWVADESRVRNIGVEYLAEHIAPGPGSAQGADSRSATTKLFHSELTYYEPWNLALYRACVCHTEAGGGESQSSLWADAERHRSSTYGERRVKGAKLFFAPKNAEISRVCCTEANVEMLLQKGIQAFLEERARWYFDINLTTQPGRNAHLAEIGSRHGSLGTIDLVSASDSNWCALIDAALDGGALKGLLFNLRAKAAVLPDGSIEPLSMMSTMGNAFTFPLTTIILAAAVRAVRDVTGNQDPWGVFGDDIIVGTSVFTTTVNFVTLLGFEVNLDKSYGVGPFRESCGTDAFLGYNIRGVYIKSLETPQHVYSAINRLLRWCSRTGIPLPRTLSLLNSWVRFLPVPPSEADDAGIKVPFFLKRLPAMPVTNQYWFQYRCWVAQRRTIDFDCDYCSDSEIRVNQWGVGASVLAGWLTRPDTDPTYPGTSDSLGFRTSLVKQFTNSVFEAGIRENPGVRKRYKSRTRSIPWWDYRHRSTQEILQGDGTWRRVAIPEDGGWEAAVRAAYSIE